MKYVESQAPSGSSVNGTQQYGSLLQRPWAWWYMEEDYDLLTCLQPEQAEFLGIFILLDFRQ